MDRRICKRWHLRRVRRFLRSVCGNAVSRDIITHHAQITPDWLTRVLRRKGNLARGRVLAVELREVATLVTSEFAYLRVKYSEDVSLPARFFLKYYRQGTDDRWILYHQREAQFYALASQLPLRVARCFDQRNSKDWRRGFLLLEDLTETHDRHWDLSPAEQVRAIPNMVRHLAETHAAWWQHPFLGSGLAAPPNIDFINLQLEAALPRLVPEGMAWTTVLSPMQLALYKAMRCPEVLNHLYPGTHPGALFTLEHGQPHPANFMFRRDDGSLAALLVDWQSYRVGLGAYDVAHLLNRVVLAWREPACETEFLQLYYDELCAAGITEYSRAQLEMDYRWGILYLWWKLLFENPRPDQRSDFFSRVNSTWHAIQRLECQSLLQENPVLV